MVRPQKLIEAVISNLQGASGIPDAVNFVGYLPNPDVEAIKLPIISVSVNDRTNLRPYNSQFIGFVENNAGNDVQRQYEMEYLLELDVQVWTAQGSQYSPRDIGDSVRTKLFDYTKHGPGLPLTHPSLGNIDEVWNFVIDTEGHEDDLTTTPTLRRWRATIEISASEVYTTTAKDPITAFTESVEVL